MVNVGAFSGKTIVQPLREQLGNEGFVVLNLFAAGDDRHRVRAGVAVLPQRRPTAERKSIREMRSALGRAVLVARTTGGADP